MGKYGTNLEGFGAFEGGVNADKGAPLVSTSSDGETALLFGPAALREIQAGVANGDFAIPPDAAGDTITEENPLPYWTFTDDDSAGAITCAIVADSGSGSGNILRWTVAAGTTTGKTATLSRYVPVPATRDRAYSFLAELTAGGATNTTSRQIVLRYQYHKQDLTTTGSEYTTTYALSTFASTRSVPFTVQQTPADAAFLKLSIQVDTTGTNASATTVDMYEVKTVIGNPYVLASTTDAGTPPGAMWKSGTDLYIAGNLGSFDPVSGGIVPTDAYLLINSSGVLLGDGDFSVNGQAGIAVSAAATDALLVAVVGDSESRLIIDGDGKHNWGSGSAVQDTNLYRSAVDTLKTDDSLVVAGSIGLAGSLYGASSLTGPRIVLGGTNTRLWQHANPACDVAASTSSVLSGVLITKQVLGQPTTTINGTGTTDAFADGVRGGAIAVDATNNRAYFYSGGWKYAALTTPSDSRLKEEITEISGALDTLRQLVPVAFKWKRPEAHGRAECVDDTGKRLGFIADQVATTDLKHWVETLGVDEREADLVDTTEVLAVNIPQNEMEALVVQALLDIDTRLKALESR
jgi:hypothetical protein